MLLDFAIQVRLDFQVGVDVIELRLVFAIEFAVISHDDAWCFY